MTTCLLFIFCCPEPTTELPSKRWQIRAEPNTRAAVPRHSKVDGSVQKCPPGGQTTLAKYRWPEQMGSNPKRPQTRAQERDHLSWVRGTHQFWGKTPPIGEKERREQRARVQTTPTMETLGAVTGAFKAGNSWCYWHSSFTKKCPVPCGSRAQETRDRQTEVPAPSAHEGELGSFLNEEEVGVWNYTHPSHTCHVRWVSQPGMDPTEQNRLPATRPSCLGSRVPAWGGNCELFDQRASR